MIERLDQIDGDPDFEDGDEDRCHCGDDDITRDDSFGQGDGYPGDPDDAEDGNDAEPEDEGAEREYSTPPIYGLDQSRGPINEEDACRAYMRAQLRIVPEA